MHQPLIIIGKHSITLRPELSELLLGYVNYCLKVMRRERDEYLNVHPQVQEDDQAFIKLQRKIEEAQALISALEQLKDRVSRVYEQNFYHLADVVKKTLSDLGFERIDEVYTIAVLVENLMVMLKDENGYFNTKKFKDYINQGERVYGTTTRENPRSAATVVQC